MSGEDVFFKVLSKEMVRYPKFPDLGTRHMVVRVFWMMLGAWFFFGLIGQREAFCWFLMPDFFWRICTCGKAETEMGQGRG